MKKDIVLFKVIGMDEEPNFFRGFPFRYDKGDTAVHAAISVMSLAQEVAKELQGPDEICISFTPKYDIQKYCGELVQIIPLSPTEKNEFLEYLKTIIALTLKKN